MCRIMIISVKYNSSKKSSKFSSFEEIPDYDKVVYLNCAWNGLNTLPQLPNSLQELHCDNNQLSSLLQLPNSLQELHCSENQLSSLSQLPNSLTYLDCRDNQLSSLPQLPNSLQTLHCGNNQLSSLPELPNSLKKLYCSNNQLSSLPQLPNSLCDFCCENNQFVKQQENYLQKIIYCISQHREMFLYNLFEFFGKNCSKCNYQFLNLDKYRFTKWEERDVAIENSFCYVCSKN